MHFALVKEKRFTNTIENQIGPYYSKKNIWGKFAHLKGHVQIGDPI